MQNLYLKINTDTSHHEVMDSHGTVAERALQNYSYKEIYQRFQDWSRQGFFQIEDQVFTAISLPVVPHCYLIVLSLKIIEKKSPEDMYLKSLGIFNAANKTFSDCPTINDLCYHAVKMAKESLRLDRAAVLLISPEGDQILGTWGTDQFGEIQQESDLCLELKENKWMQEALKQKGSLIVNDNVPLKNYGEDVGLGWNAIISMWYDDKALGWFVCDNLLSGGDLTVEDRVLISLYGSTIGQWFIRKNAEYELQNMNETLERQVADKTAKLQETIDRLSSTQKDLVNIEKGKTLSNFTAGIAHEINNPIGFIKGNLSFIGKVSSKILGSLKVLDNPEFEKSMVMLEEMDQVIDESISGLDRVTNIIRMLQPLNKLSDESAQEFEVLQSIDFFIMGLESGAEYIQLERPEKPVMVYLPLQVFTLALENILANALDAVADVSEPIITLKIIIDDIHFGIEISDNGHGISAANINSIFDPFFTTKAVGEGMGLGLSLSENLLKMVSGEISASSVEGKGTTVKILFPKEVIVSE